MNEQGRLAIGCLGQLFDRAVPRDGAQFSIENFVRFPKNIGRDWKLIGQILPHSNDLCTLSGKKQRNLSHLLYLNALTNERERFYAAITAQGNDILGMKKALFTVVVLLCIGCQMDKRFSQLQTGMTKAQVMTIVGKKPTGDKTVNGVETLEWETGSHYAKFKNGRLTDYGTE